jgi:hypothetical protein
MVGHDMKYLYKPLLDSKLDHIKAQKKSRWWTYSITFLHSILVIWYIQMSINQFSIWYLIAALCWGICVVIDIFTMKRNNKQKVRLEIEYDDMLKEYDIDEWKNRIRIKKFKRILTK